MAPALGLAQLRAPRAYILRLPLLTRVLPLVFAVVWLLGWFPGVDLRAWWALVPTKVGILSAHRATTYPFVHVSLLHAIFNVVALTPLMERFESENGTLATLSLFVGPLTTIPALLYVITEVFILRMDTPVMGASVWVFLLLGMEAIRTYRTNPHIVIGTHHVPTWTTPLALVLVISVLVPGTSLLGHLCGLGVGYLFGLGYLRFLAPPEKALRWVETRFNLLARLPRYVSVDQKTYGRFGVLPSSGAQSNIELAGGGQRLGP